MIKIAQICAAPKTVGGILNYCNALQTLFENDKNFNISVYPLKPIKKIFGFPIYSKNQIQNILLEKYDIIHINGFISTVPIFVFSIMKILKLNTPLVFTPHAHPFYTLNHPFRNRIFFHLFVKPVLKNSNIIISINKEDYEFYKKYNKTVITIPHWLNHKISQTNKIISNKPLILFVGRNDSNKNLKVLYAIPPQKYEVVCVTNIKPDREDFIFKTNISDIELAELYRQASITVVPSRYEAFSYTALESLLSGTPVLVSNRVRITDFLDGVSGVTIYNYEDESEFIKKLDKAMGEKVDISIINERFSKENALKSYIIAYQSALGRIEK